MLVAAITVVTVDGCVTPSIPIPPPDPAKMTFQVFPQTGTASFAYPPEQNYIGAVVYVFNRDSGRGIIETAHDDGSVGPTQPLGAAIGNSIVVTFQHDDQSVSTCVRMRDGQQSAADYCQ